eukprot:377846-Hanusia_phi.AAC.1
MSAEGVLASWLGMVWPMKRLVCDLGGARSASMLTAVGGLCRPRKCKSRDFEACCAHVRGPVSL